MKPSKFSIYFAHDRGIRSVQLARVVSKDFLIFVYLGTGGKYFSFPYIISEPNQAPIYFLYGSPPNSELSKTS